MMDDFLPDEPRSTRGTDIETAMESEDTVPVELTPLAQQMRRAKKGGKKAYIVFLDGMNTGKIIALQDKPIIVGKNRNCDVVVGDDGVSRVHAQIHFVDHRRAVIQDLGSTNGTFVEGSKIEKAIVTPGEKILFGRRTMAQFVMWDRLEHVYNQELFASCPCDGLTGLHNRKFLKKRMGSDISYARRHHIAYTLLLADVDNFGRINHAFGPYSGDQVLVSLSQTLDNMVRSEDVVGRFGCDEFAVLAQGIDRDGGMRLAHRIRAEAENLKIRAVNDKKEIIQVTVSIGIATIHPDAVTDRDTLIASATRELTNAKQLDGNQICQAYITPNLISSDTV